MSDNDDDPEEPPEDGDDAVEVADVDAIEERLDAAEAALAAAETEADLDEVEADLAAATLPEPEDEDEEDPAEALESRLSELRDGLAEARGPYAEDVAAAVESAESTVAGESWTEQGVDELGDAVWSFVSTVENVLGVKVDVDVDEPSFAEEPHVGGEQLDALRETLDEAAAAVTDAGLDPDDDTEEIETLLEAAEALTEAVEAAQTWDDLSVRRKLHAQGYFDPLEHRKDYPPEWGALKLWEQRGRADMVLLAYDLLDSEFMEQHCLAALERMGSEEALEPMLDLAGKRDNTAIRILGTTASDEALDTLVEYVDGGDRQLRTVTLQALGEIGSHEATQAVANQLADDEPAVRSQAARSLGLLGDTRAIEPLADRLADDEADRVRASAAWALNQIGTERALAAVREYADDRSYLVQSEAEKAV
jgi:HEAT repeat protein